MRAYKNRHIPDDKCIRISKKRRIVDVKHLLFDFCSLFSYCITIACLVFDFFTHFELLENILFNGYS